MSLYLGRQNQSTVAALDTVHHILASATARGGMCELVISSDATPVEQMGEYQIARTTSTGTTPAGSTTAVKASNFSPTPGCTYGGGGYTTEPTLGDLLMDFSVHQKLLYRWVGYPGRELWTAPAANAGIGVMVIQQSAAYALSSSIAWIE